MSARAALALASVLAVLAATAVAQEEGVPALVVFGDEAAAGPEDPRGRQEIVIDLAADAPVHHLRLFDAATGSPLDTPAGAGETRFALFGAEREGAPLAETVFSAEDGAGVWTTLATLDPADGAQEAGRSRFLLVVEGRGGGANVFDVIATPEAEGTVPGPDARLTVTQAALRVPRRDFALEIAFDAPLDVDRLEVETFDLAGGTVTFTGPFRSEPLDSSPQGAWRGTEVAVTPEERGTRLAVTVDGGEVLPNDTAVRVFAVEGETRRALPLLLPPGGLLPNGRPTAVIEARAMDCVRVELDAGRSTDPEGEALSYLWRFDDGRTAEGRRVAQDFPGPGRYGVRLEVRDPGRRVGNGAAAEAEILVREPPRSVIAPIPEVVAIGETVTLDGSASAATDEDVSIARHEWLLTDGALLEGAVVEHRFEVQGVYGLRLLVIDDSGHPCRSAAAQAAVRVNAPPRAVAGGDLLVDAGASFTLDGRASADPDGEIAAHRWRIAPLDAGAAPAVTLEGAQVTHAVETPGTYRVTLTVDDGTGVANATDSDDLILTVNAAPVAEAGPDLSVAVGDLVPLDASLSRDPDGAIVAYVWDLGNGDRVAGRAPDYAFQREGTYEVALSVTDDSGLPGGTATDSLRVSVGPRPNAAPVADAGPDRHAIAGEPVLLDASGSADPDGNLIGYAWEFGDGRLGEGLRLSHAWMAPGVYTIRLTVQDDSGLANDRATDTAEIRIRPRPNAPPIAAAGPDREALVGERVVFDGTASRDEDGAILGYVWDFGDGGRGRGPVVSHAFTRPGVYEVTLEVEDDGPGGDGRATDSATVTVSPVPNAPPVARAGADRVVALGETVRLDGSGSGDADGNLIAWVWDLGDGRRATGPVVEHVYDAPGLYPVRLTVQDDSGRPNDRAEDGLEIRVNAPPVAAAGPDRAAAAGAVLALDGSRAQDPDGTLIRHDWRMTDAAGETVAEAEGAEAEIPLEAPGRFRVTLTVEDDAGVANSVAEAGFDLVVNAAPVAVAGPDLEVEAGARVPFDAGQSRDADGLLVSYDWAFGNGDRGRGAQPVYAYHEPGEYVVTLTVTDDSGLPNATASDRMTVRVAPRANAAPVAEAGPDREVLVGERLVLDGGDSRDPDGEILTYRWDFGDGREAVGPSPSHAYWTPGDYTLRLTVTDDSGRPNDTGSDRATIRVRAAPNVAPVAEAGPDRRVRVGDRVAFDGSASSDPDGSILSYAWDFGDGAGARGPRALYVYRAPGDYAVTLTVRDDGPGDGAAGTDRLTVTVAPNPDWIAVPERAEAEVPGPARGDGAATEEDTDE